MILILGALLISGHFTPVHPGSRVIPFSYFSLRQHWTCGIPGWQCSAYSDHFLRLLHFFQKYTTMVLWVSFSFFFFGFCRMSRLFVYNCFRRLSSLIVNCFLTSLNIIFCTTLRNLWRHSFAASYTKTGDFFEGTSGYWSWLFCLSKFAELGDTLLIVLRKKPLLFLHWYHHVLTLNYGIISYSDHTPYNSWIIWLNFTVHSFMYRCDIMFWGILL